MRNILALLGLAAFLALSPAAAQAQSITVTIKDHKFTPSEIKIPANKRVEITVVNDDATPEEFESYRRLALGKGFLMVSASPLTRSSYHAGEDFARLRAARTAALAEQG